MDYLKKWVETSSLKMKLVVGVLGSCLVIVVFLVWQMAQIETADSKANWSSISTTELAVSESVAEDETFIEETNEILIVDVKGAVEKPGVYQGTSKMRLIDIVELAGGFLETANQVPLNLAMRLEDQMVIYIPNVGEEIPEEISNSLNKTKTDSQEESSKTELNTSERININVADSHELQKLNGVGEKKAELIIQYREENGSFQTIEDVKNISGIGAKIFEGLKEQITVGQ